jgi:sigma-54 specific flagellar transcriptional regulator A
LLARGAWIDAERHFATDACEAACQGDVTCELRARLNRAIALLSSGRRDEARAMLNEVLVEGERAGEPRAVSFALQNLATIAILKHEYTDALRLAEQAIDVCRAVGEKIALARLIANLAELRLRLGLVAEADQALAFGRKACGPSIPASRAAHFALVAARVRLARGNTLEAAAEVAAALAAVGASSDGAKLGECYRIAARIALEDGDLARMAHALEKARAAANSAGAKAEVTLLEAHRARAAGEPYLEIGLEALELVRSADDGELAREAHTLLARARFDADDSAAARAHVAAALALQACVADALPDELRARFLARRDLAELARLAAHRDEPQDDARSGDGRVRPSARPDAQARTIVGKDPTIVALLAAVQKIGPSDATVLVHGESGTGKELVADAIHRASDRRNGPLVKVNCAALVETLLLSELFGHEKGSFTGAASRRRGRFEMAEGGTLFLDEIGDISPRTQVALLRVLQEKTFERVGGVTQIQADVRIVCATHRDLKAMVARGEFREDLYYRLRGVVLEVPALRSRLGDLGAIADSILARVASERGVPVKRIAQGALAALKAHSWPGNVRELDNALRAAALFADGDVLATDDFSNNVESLRDLIAPPTLSSPSGIGAASVAPEMPIADVPPSTREQGGASTTEMAYASVRSGVSLSDMKRLIEKECIERALAESGGNITRAATLLGMKRPRLSQLVKQYGFGGVDADAEDM